jgi:hypothetical protein
MLTAIVLVVFILTAALDWLPGVKNKPKNETAVYGLIIVAALTILFLYSVGVKVPCPSVPIRNAVQAIFPVK